MILLALVTGSVGTLAQWLNHQTPGTPRTKDGKPNLKALAPRTADGKPDLSGVWMPEPAPLEELAKFIPGHVDGAQTLGEAKPSRYFMNALSDFKPDEIVMTPAAEALFKQRADSYGKDLPTSYCLPFGVPIIDASLIPRKIVQLPTLVLLLYEEPTAFRQIYLDGRRIRLRSGL